MDLEQQSIISNCTLSDSQFYKLSHYITENYGIKLPLEKKVMLQSRLRKRLLALKLQNFAEYIEYLFQNKSENEHLIIEVSTNKTDMFREIHHFEYIANEFLPNYISEKSQNEELKIWSSACSSGEEPYTTAIVIEEFMLKNRPINYRIWSSDISTKMIQKAFLGIYKMDAIKDLPLELKKRYFLKSKDKLTNNVRVKPEIRSKAKFILLNLMDKTYDVPSDFDIIFCRNVLIYFNKETQEQVVGKLINKLKRGGILFIGHSESLMGMQLPIEMIKPTIFRKL